MSRGRGGALDIGLMYGLTTWFRLHLSRLTTSIASNLEYFGRRSSFRPCFWHSLICSICDFDRCLSTHTFCLNYTKSLPSRFSAWTISFPQFEYSRLDSNPKFQESCRMGIGLQLARSNDQTDLIKPKTNARTRPQFDEKPLLTSNRIRIFDILTPSENNTTRTFPPNDPPHRTNTTTTTTNTNSFQPLPKSKPK